MISVEIIKQRLDGWDLFKSSGSFRGSFVGRLQELEVVGRKSFGGNT